MSMTASEKEAIMAARGQSSQAITDAADKLIELEQQRDKPLAALEELESAREMLRAYNNMLVEIADALDVAPYLLTDVLAVAKIRNLKAIEAAARNLAKVKGRHNSEIAYNRLMEALK